MDKVKEALEEFDRFCRSIDGMHMSGTFVENDFMSKSVQKIIREALMQQSWHPIVEAPRDETEVLGYFDGKMEAFLSLMVLAGSMVTIR